MALIFTLILVLLISLHCVTDLDIFIVIGKVKSDGVDNILIWFLKLIYSHISNVVLHLFNTVLTVQFLNLGRQPG